MKCLNGIPPEPQGRTQENNTDKDGYQGLQTGMPIGVILVGRLTPIVGPYYNHQIRGAVRQAMDGIRHDCLTCPDDSCHQFEPEEKQVDDEPCQSDLSDIPCPRNTL